MTRTFRFLFRFQWPILALPVCITAAAAGGLAFGSPDGLAPLFFPFLPRIFPFLLLLAGWQLWLYLDLDLSLGGRRTDIFWGIQGCALVYALFTTLLMLAANAISGALGWPALGLNPTVLLFYPFACFGLSILGALAGLLASRLRWLAAVLLAFLVVLSLVLFLPLLIYSQDRFDTWGILPWFIPLLLALVWLAGEVFLCRELQRLCVR